MLSLAWGLGAAAQRLPPIVAVPQAATTPAAAPAQPQLLGPSATAPTLPVPSEIMARKDIETGNRYFQQAHYRGALARFEDAIYNAPAHAEAYCRAGDAEIKLRHRLPARVDWERCLAKAGKTDARWTQHARQALRQYPLPPSDGTTVPGGQEPPSS